MVKCTADVGTVEGTGTEVTEGGNLGGIADFFSDQISRAGRNWSRATSVFGENDLSRFLSNELAAKGDLRGAQIEAFLSGIPIAGDFLRGVNGVEQLEDLYNSTGKTAAYPASQNLGMSGFGYGAAGIVRKIENGSNDLYRYYAGEPDQWSASMYQ